MVRSLLMRHHGWSDTMYNKRVPKDWKDEPEYKRGVADAKKLKALRRKREAQRKAGTK